MPISNRLDSCTLYSYYDYMKYKIVGVGNAILGIVEIYLGVGIQFIVVPRMLEVYEEFQLGQETINQATRNSFIYFLLFVFLGAVNILLAMKLFDKKRRETYFNWALGVLIGTIVIGGILAQLSAISSVQVLYSLTEQLK